MKKFVTISTLTLICAASVCFGIFIVPIVCPPASKYASEVVYGDIFLSSPLYPSAPGISVAENKYASIDYSNVSQGYVSVQFKGSSSGGQPVMKIICGENEYTYILGDREDVFPLTCGDGDYTIKIYRYVGEGEYTAVLTKILSVTLENQLLPYLYPSRMANYTADSAAVKKADEMCQNAADDLEKLKIIYKFIIENIIYDYKKAANIEKGYISSVESTYISKSGICFDYAVMMAAMLRSQNIPVKLVTGYLNGTSVFHAWNEVYLKNSGWITVNILVNAKTFRMLDTTLASSQSDEEISKKLDNSSVYAPVYKY